MGHSIGRAGDQIDGTAPAIARGIAIGDELEYADEVTLGRSLMQRIPFENSLNNR